MLGAIAPHLRDIEEVAADAEQHAEEAEADREAPAGVEMQHHVEREERHEQRGQILEQPQPEREAGLPLKAAVGLRESLGQLVV